MCENVPLVSDDGDGFAVVVCESHLNHVVYLSKCCVCYVIIIAHMCDKSGQSQPLFSK